MDNTEEIKSDSSLNDDDLLLEPAVEPTAEEQAEHDASFGDASEVETIEAESNEDSAEESDEGSIEDSETVEEAADSEETVESTDEVAEEAEVATDSEEAVEVVEEETVEVSDEAAEEPAEEAVEETVEEQAEALEDTVTFAKDSAVVDFIRDNIDEIVICDEERSKLIVQITNVEDSLEDIDIDWALMDLALDGILGDATLSTEERNKLPESAFCGPDRSFPVPDCAHVTAARRLIGRAKLTASAKARVLACVNKKAGTMKCDDSSDAVENTPCECESVDSLKEGYAHALSQVDTLKAKLEESLAMCAKLSGVNIVDTEDSSRLTVLSDWFDGLHQVNETEVVDSDNVQIVEDPTDSDINQTVKTTKDQDVQETEMSDFESRIVNKYKTLRNNEGEWAADSYLMRNRRFLSRDFDPTKLLK